MSLPLEDKKFGNNFRKSIKIKIPNKQEDSIKFNSNEEESSIFSPQTLNNNPGDIFLDNASSRQSTTTKKNFVSMFIQQIIKRTILPKVSIQISLVSAIQFFLFVSINITLIILVTNSVQVFLNFNKF